jgi:polyisoprenyl-phosphate glycosyltransferase
MDQNKNNISIIIPCFNESNNIQLLFNKISANITDHTLEVIFIDDGSTDDTLDQIKQLAIENSSVRYLSFSRNFGHQNALKAGIDYAKGECIIMMDADLQHPAELIPSMIKKWHEGYDIVYTIREDSRSDSYFKKTSSNLFYSIINSLSETKIERGAADFRLIDKKVAGLFKHNINEYFLFIRGLSSWVGFRQFALHYKTLERHSGKSKYSFIKMLSFAINGITSFSIKPLRLAIFLGILVSSLSFVYGGYALFASLVLNQAIPGWTSIIVTVLFIGGIQMFLIGIIGEYIGKIFLEVKKRPHYILKETNYAAMPDM